MIKTARQLKDLIRNLSRKNAADAQILMRNYMMERFLERTVRALATEQYEMRFPPRMKLDEMEDDYEEYFDFYMDEETDIE